MHRGSLCEIQVCLYDNSTAAVQKDCLYIESGPCQLRINDIAVRSNHIKMNGTLAMATFMVHKLLENFAVACNQN